MEHFVSSLLLFRINSQKAIPEFRQMSYIFFVNLFVSQSFKEANIHFPVKNMCKTSQTLNTKNGVIKYDGN